MYNIPAQYHSTIKKALIASAAAGPLGVLPTGALDAGAIFGIWSTMLCSMLHTSGIAMDKDAGVKLVTSVVIGSASYYAGCKMASKVFNWIPFAGLIIGAGVSTAANVLFTYQFAWVLSCLLEEDQITTDTVKTMGPEIIKRMGMGSITLQTGKDILSIMRA